MGNRLKIRIQPKIGNCGYSDEWSSFNLKSHNKVHPVPIFHNRDSIV